MFLSALVQYCSLPEYMFYHGQEIIAGPVFASILQHQQACQSMQ